MCVTGANFDATWHLYDGINNQYAIGVQTLTFSYVEYVTGGSGGDIFQVAAGATINLFIDGGSGSDTIDYSAYVTDVTSISLPGQG